MAKSKKTETSTESTPAAPKKAAARKAAPAKAAPVNAAAPQSPATPSFAAEAAAAMIGNKAQTSSSNQGEARKESNTFKQLKDSLNRTSGQSIGNALPTTGGQTKKTGAPFGVGKQVGHNQTFSDFSRRNLPRRTGG